MMSLPIMGIRLAVLLLFILVIAFPQKAFASSVVINEFMAAPSTGNNEWIEFYNPNHLDLSGYWIDDDISFDQDDGNSSKKSLSTLTNNNQTYPYIELTNSIFNNPGDFVVLFAGDGTLVDQYQYTSNPGTDTTLGRSLDGGSWVTLTAISKGSANGSSSSPSLSPTPSPTPTSTPVPTSTPSPTPAPTPTPTPTPTSQASFTISEIPSQINSDQAFSAKVTLVVPNNPNTEYYMKGAFKKVGGNRYFGLTKTTVDWIEYGDENTDQYKITTDGSGKWSGNLEIKPDINDKDYKGQGDYVFKVGRLTSSGSSPIWSNEREIKINVQSVVENVSSGKSISTEQIQTDQESESSESKEVTIRPRLALDLTSSSETASVAGEATYDASSNSPKLKPEYLALSGTGLVVISGVLGWFLKQKLIRM